jgi:hypothetical protein
VSRRRDHSGRGRDPAHPPAPSEPDEPAGGDDGAHPGNEDGTSGFDAWRRRSATGEVGTAIARGLAAVFAPAENRPVISAPVPGDPPDPDQGFLVVLDPDDPAKSVAVFAPKSGQAPAQAQAGAEAEVQPQDPPHPTSD